ncbi:MAG: transcriptional regulator, GntR family [Ramlibacter sp.]|jgi:DNA-binding GntR family transcriptional regulator|nr:transcriptional regulator, GntR family [Ramlibacter sp.]MDF2462450.1 transcriptional regulator, GntR family [Ramlibacter sp.]
MVNKGKAGQAYHDIEQLIVSEALEPGTLVSESLLMEKTGLGRTPIREALQQLARNRMVEIHPNRGVLIPPASVESQLRMLEVRRVLEALAGRLACHNANGADRARMEDMVHRLTGAPMPLAEYADALKDTHQMVATAGHNEYLADAMAPLHGLSRRFWLAHIQHRPDEIVRGAAHNLAILRAILAREPDAAEQACLALNDYLVQFAYSTITRHPRSSSG